MNVSNDGLWRKEPHKVKSKWTAVNWTLDFMMRNITHNDVYASASDGGVFCSAFHQWRSTAAESSTPQQNKSFFTCVVNVKFAVWFKCDEKNTNYKIITRKVELIKTNLSLMNPSLNEHWVTFADILPTIVTFCEMASSKLWSQELFFSFNTFKTSVLTLIIIKTVSWTNDYKILFFKQSCYNEEWSNGCW